MKTTRKVSIYNIARIRGSGGRSVRALDWRPGGPGFESRYGNLIRFGTLTIPFFGGDTESRRFLLISGVYSTGSATCLGVDSTTVNVSVRKGQSLKITRKKITLCVMFKFECSHAVAYVYT